MNDFLNRKVEIWSKFSIVMSKCLPVDLQYLPYLFPTGYRNPEVEQSFHPKLEKDAFSNHLMRIPRSILRGAHALIFKRFGFFTYQNNSNAEILTIAPKFLCQEKYQEQDQSFYSKYLSVKDNEVTAWLLFEEGQKTNSPLSRSRALSNLLKILISLLKSLSSRPSDISKDEWSLAFLSNLNYALALNWTDKVALHLKLTEILKSNPINLVHCVHEFHPHAKAVWDATNLQDINSSTIQHASDEIEKTWLFPTAEEIQNGHPSPKNIFAYNPQVVNQWKSTLPSETKYHLANGPRFSHWKKTSPFKKIDNNNLVFMTSLAWWDNEVVLLALKKLLNSEYKISLRRHPHAQLTQEQRTLIQKLVQSGKISLAEDRPLKEVIESHSISIGMCSTVLDEALLLGRMSIKLLSDEFTSLGSSKSYQLNVNELTPENIREIKDRFAKDRQNLIASSYEKFGISFEEASLLKLLNPM